MQPLSKMFTFCCCCAGNVLRLWTDIRLLETKSEKVYLHYQSTSFAWNRFVPQDHLGLKCAPKGYYNRHFHLSQFDDSLSADIVWLPSNGDTDESNVCFQICVEQLYYWELTNCNPNPSIFCVLFVFSFQCTAPQWEKFQLLWTWTILISWMQKKCLWITIMSQSSLEIVTIMWCSSKNSRKMVFEKYLGDFGSCQICKLYCTNCILRNHCCFLCVFFSSNTAFLKSGTWSKKIYIARASKGEDISIHLISSEYGQLILKVDCIWKPKNIMCCRPAS